MIKNQPPSNKKFGLFFSGIFALMTAYAYLKFRSEFAIFALITSALFAIAAFLTPEILTHLNRLWFSLGLLLGKVVSPIALGLIFFLLITPVALVTRLFGRDELKIKKRTVTSYWVDRSPPGPPSESFENQY
jgi:hypothetical protein